MPDLARQVDAPARQRAALALARTLYAMGRFGEALAALPDQAGEAAPALLELRLHCLWLLGESQADLEQAWRIAYPDHLDTLRARADFAYLMNEPARAGPVIQAYAEATGGHGEHGAWAALLADWLEPARDGRRSHSALAWLRAHRPARGAEGEALHAEARFRQAPAHALVWLDHALDQAELYGQHHLRARLLHRKALALEAAGHLGVAARFLALARETAQRQGAWRYVHDMAV